MAEPFEPLLERSFPASEFAAEFERLKDDGTEQTLQDRLCTCNARKTKRETL
jgi:hypothetical protein